MALFPPIVASSMPAFAIGENTDNNVKIYFTLSNYNSAQKESIKAVHISVRRQSSNVNVLKTGNQILQKFINEQTEEDKILNRYSITLENNDLIKGFEENVLYKVQLRLSNVVGSTNSEGNIPVSFFTDNIQSFSEWSQVCIIKPIKAPIFYIDDFHHGKEDDYGQQDSDLDTFTYNLAEFIGIYKQDEESQNENEISQNQQFEQLKGWRLRLLNNNFTESEKLYIDDYTLADSGWKSASAYNYTLDNTALSFECSLMYDFTRNVSNNEYKLFFEIQTKNGFKDYKIYSFTFQQVNIDALQGNLYPYLNNEQGYIKILFKTNDNIIGNVVLRRSDSKGNFLNWQDLTNFVLPSNKQTEQGDIIYYDFTPESGLAYKYLIQRRDPRGRRGSPIQCGPIIPEWQHAFLLQDAGDGEINNVKQLKLKYDFQISSYKTNISENKTDTIGSKYPFIRRNGEMYYRSFPITGTITAYMDNIDLFISKSILYDNQKETFDKYKGLDYDYNLNKQYDYVYERKFREEVEKFLYNAKPKLYKSTQQGNIFIKIMEVSLTPKQELDRMIYSFSGTAYEIDEASLKTLNDYGFITIGTFDPEPAWSEEKLGQITSYKSQDEPLGNIFKAGQDIIGVNKNKTSSDHSIARKHRYNRVFNNTILDDFYLDHLKITVESEPYLIIEDLPNHYRVFDDIDKDGMDPINFTYPIDSPLYQIESTYNGYNIYLGTLFEINNEQIIISYPNNIYELKDNNLRLASNTTIVPMKDTVMTVDYKIHESLKESLLNVPKRITIEDKVGQIYGTYNHYSKILNEIKNKYTFTYTGQNDQGIQETIKQYISSFPSMLIDTEPGTVIEVCLAGPGQALNKKITERLVINETGELDINPEDTSYEIVQFIIKGHTLDFNSLTLREGTRQTIENPMHGDYCIENEVYYTFYKSQWYESEIASSLTGKSNLEDLFMDIYCPVDAMIFYTLKLRRDYL